MSNLLDPTDIKELVNAVNMGILALQVIRTKHADKVCLEQDNSMILKDLSYQQIVGKELELVEENHHTKQTT